MKNFSAADIRVFLAEHLPYYESEDKDDFLYIVKAADLEKVSLGLYDHLTAVEVDAKKECTCNRPRYSNYRYCPDCKCIQRTT